MAINPLQLPPILSVPQVNYAPLDKLGDAVVAARQQQQLADAAAATTKDAEGNTVPDYKAIVKNLFGIGQVDKATNVAKIAQQQSLLEGLQAAAKMAYPVDATPTAAPAVQPQATQAQPPLQPGTTTMPVPVTRPAVGGGDAKDGTSIVGIVGAAGIPDDKAGPMIVGLSNSLKIDPNAPIADPAVRQRIAQVAQSRAQPPQGTQPQPPMQGQPQPPQQGVGGPPMQPPLQGAPQPTQRPPQQLPQQGQPQPPPQQAVPTAANPPLNQPADDPTLGGLIPRGRTVQQQLSILSALEGQANATGIRNAGQSFRDQMQAIQSRLQPTNEYKNYLAGREGNETPADYQSRVAREKATGEKIGAAVGGQIADYIDQGRTAQKRVQQLDVMRDALERGKGNITTGPFADLVLRSKQAYSDMFGIDVKGLPESEVVQKMGFGFATQAVKEISSRPSQQEFLKGMENNPGLLLSPKGSLLMMDVLRQAARQDVEISKLAQNPKNQKNWPDVLDKYYTDHPLTSPFDHTRELGLKDLKEIDPQAQTQGAQSKSATAAPPPVPGARLAPDGKYYVSDPSRPGKYLMVR